MSVITVPYSLGNIDELKVWTCPVIFILDILKLGYLIHRFGRRGFRKLEASVPFNCASCLGFVQADTILLNVTD